MISRRLVALAAPALLLAAAIPAWGVGVEPQLLLRTAEHRIPWAGPRLRVALLADFHAGPPTFTIERVRGVVEAANALRPDLVLLLGDYGSTARRVTWKPYAPAEVAPALAALRAPLGVHAIAGNHDWWDDAAAMRRQGGMPEWLRALAAEGVRTYQNAAAPLPGFWLAGLDSQWAFRRAGGADDLRRTLGAVPLGAPLILMAHEPDVFAGGSPRVSLQVSGHTHGGQVRIAGWSPWIPSRYGDRYVRGHVEEEGRHLLVSSGLGMSGWPVRLGVPPEIVLVTLG